MVLAMDSCRQVGIGKLIQGSVVSTDLLWYPALPSSICVDSPPCLGYDQARNSWLDFTFETSDRFNQDFTVSFGAG